MKLKCQEEKKDDDSEMLNLRAAVKVAMIAVMKKTKISFMMFWRVRLKWN
jgi:hypothetical protein